VGVDGIVGKVINQIGLEDDRLALDVDWKEGQTGREELVNLLGVLLHVQDRDS
jgi:hypothetical protein